MNQSKLNSKKLHVADVKRGASKGVSIGLGSTYDWMKTLS